MAIAPCNSFVTRVFKRCRRELAARYAAETGLVLLERRHHGLEARVTIARLGILTFGILTLVWLLAFVAGCKREQSADAPSASAPPVAAASQPAAHVLIRIAAAADLRFALEDVASTFQRLHREIELKATYGSSGNFFTQLSNHAPFDVFLSADASYPQKLVDQGLAAPATMFHYAVGRIVIWAPNDSKLDLPKLGMRAILEPAVKKISIANPEHAPYGRAAVAAMKSAGVYDAAKDRLVLGENISQAAQFVESGSADAGIIALSLALAPQMKDKGRYWEVPADSYPPLDQAGVIVNWAGDAQAADVFRGFMLSDEARVTMARFGFAAPLH